MPTANANTGNSFRSTLSYVYQEGIELPEDEQAVTIEENNVFGNSTAGQARVMRTFAVERPSIKTPVMHLQINFHPDEKLTNEDAKQVIYSILSDIGVSADNCQYVIVQHRDKAHNHYHVVLNRVCLDQSIIETHRIKDRLQVACDKVEQTMNLRPTTGRTVVYAPESERGYVYTNKRERKLNKTICDKNTAVKEVKIHLQQTLDQVLHSPGIVDSASLKQALNAHNIDVVYRETKAGITGVSFRYNNIACSGKDIGFSWSTIQQELSDQVKHSPAELEFAASHKTISKVETSNLEPILNDRKKELSPVVGMCDSISESHIYLEQKVSDVLKLVSVYDSVSLKQVLAKEHIEVIYRENRKGITGISFGYDGGIYKGNAIGFPWSVIQESLQSKTPAAVDVINSYILNSIEKESIRNVRSLVDFLIQKEAISYTSSNGYDLEATSLRVGDATCQGVQLDIKGIYQALEDVNFDLERRDKHSRLMEVTSLEKAIGQLKESVADQLYASLKQGSGLLAKDANDSIFTMYVDQAIREVMRNIDPVSNPWSTWEYLNYPNAIANSYHAIYGSIPGLLQEVEKQVNVERLLYSAEFAEEIVKSVRVKIEQEIYVEHYHLDVDQLVSDEIHTRLKQQGIEPSSVSIEKYVSDFEILAKNVSAIKSELYTLIRKPLPREILEARLVKEYNTRIHGFIEDIKQQINQKNFKIDYGALVLKNGLITKNNKIIFELDGLSVERSIEPLKKFVDGIKQSLEVYNHNVNRYNEEINPSLHKIHAVYSFTKASKIKKAENQRLLEIKANAKKPKLQINITVLNKLTLSEKGNYEKRRNGIVVYEAKIKSSIPTEIEANQHKKTVGYKL